MSWNFNNSLSGSASGNSLGNLNGGVNFAPTFSTSSGVNVTPNVGRIGAMNSFSTQTGVNFAGAEISKNIGGNPNGQFFVGGQHASNGASQFSTGFRFKF